MKKITFEQTNSALLLRLKLFALLLHASACLCAQRTNSFVFTQYSPLKGLASFEVSGGVQQDKAGYLWVGTNNGLQRFDGVKFKTFRNIPGDSTSLPSNTITRMCMNKAGNLFLMTQRGEIVLFDVHRFTCKRISVHMKEPVIDDRGLRFILDEEGNVFLSRRGGELALYDQQRGEISVSASFIPTPPGGVITTISQQPGTKKYWLGFGTGQLAIYNRITGNLSYYGHNAEREPAVELFEKQKEKYQGMAYSFFDKKGRFWFEAWTGVSSVFQYDPARTADPLRGYNVLSQLNTYYEVNNMLQQRNGRVWVSGLQVLAYFNEEEDRFIVVHGTAAARSGIEFNEIASLNEDREGNLWASTANHGLHRFNPDAEIFTNIVHSSRLPGEKGEGKGSVLSFMQLKGGDLLCGNWEDGVRRYNNKWQEVPLNVSMPRNQIFKDFWIWTFARSADGQSFWMGAQPGLGLYDENTNTAYFRHPPALNKRTIRQIVEDAQGTLWLGMHNYGLFRWVDPKNKARDSVVRVIEPGTEIINKIVTDHKGWVWVATGGSGVFVYDAKTARLLKNINGTATRSPDLPGAAVTALLPYNDSLMLVGSMDRLFIYNYRTDRFQHYQSVGSLLGNIVAMEKDAADNAWVATTNALYRLRPNNPSVLVHNRLSGIVNDRFTLAASGKLRDGRLLFGAGNSIVAFDPAKANTYQTNVPVHITAVALGKQDLLVDSLLRTDGLEMTHKNNALTIDFSTLTHSRIYAVEYMIEGVDEGWQVADRNYRIVYPFLPVGNFTLKLRPYNPTGGAVPVTQLQLHVQPPWHQTWWFYSLIALLFATQLWWLDRQRNRRKATVQKMRTDIATGLHEEVNTALNNINILSEIARIKSDREPEKAKEYLGQIQSKSNNMITAMDDMLWSLAPENDTMAKTAQRMREFTDALAQRYGTHIDLFIDQRLEKLSLNMKLRHEALLLFKEGLRSLAEAGARRCVVHLAAERQKLMLTIEFSNEGCNLQQLHNLLQRRDLEQRLLAIKARQDVQVHKSRSVILLQLPLA